MLAGLSGTPLAALPQFLTEGVGELGMTFSDHLYPPV